MGRKREAMAVLAVLLVGAVALGAYVGITIYDSTITLLGVLRGGL